MKDNHCVTKEEFYRLLGLDKNGQSIKGNFKTKTKQGYKITNNIKSKSGRRYIVGKRQDDYFVGAGYDDSNGIWDHGYYCFSSREKAVDFAKILKSER